MKKIILITYLIFSSTLVLYGQSSYELWFNSRNHDEVGLRLLKTNGDYTLAIVSIGPGQNHSYHFSKVLKISLTGDTTSWTVFKQDTLIQIFDCLETNNGNIIWRADGWVLDSAGHKSSGFQWICKTDPEFNIFWEKCYYLDFPSWGGSRSTLYQESDSTFLYLKSMIADTTGYSYTYLFKFNEQGDSLFYKIFPYLMSSSDLTSLTRNINSDILWFHFYIGDDPSLSPLKVALLDENYDSICTMYYPLQLATAPFNTVEYKNGLLSAVSYQIYNHQIEEMEWYILLMRFDDEFNMLDTTTLTEPAPDKPTYTAWTDIVDYHYENRIYVGGNFNIHSLPFSQIPSWIYIGCLDSNLNIHHEHYFGGDAFYSIFSVAASDDGGVWVTGDKYDHLIQDMERDAFIFKYDSALFVGKSEIQSGDKNKVIIYPNPGNEIIRLHCNQNNLRFRIFDQKGRLVFNSMIRSAETTIDCSQLKPGIYIWYLTNGGELYDTGKWVKLKY